jgi:diacylglycerol kinase (ATP)
MMRYAILTNPVSGTMDVERKRSALKAVSKVLDADIYGLETQTPDEFSNCARELSALFDVIVVAGGDGTFSQVINTVDIARTTVAFIPLGSGNAMKYTLQYKGGLEKLAIRIRNGSDHAVDLIDCDGKRRAYMASMGLDSNVVRLRERYRQKGEAGFVTYLKAVPHAYFKCRMGFKVQAVVDGIRVAAGSTLSLMVVKQPYYGYGIKVVPEASFYDGKLHILMIDPGLLSFMVRAIRAFTTGKAIGHYFSGQTLMVSLERPETIQIDGSVGWTANTFQFSVLKGALKLRC